MLTRSKTNSSTVFHHLPYRGRLFPVRYMKVNTLYPVLMNSDSTSKGAFLSVLTDQSKKFERLVLNLLETRLGSKIPYLYPNSHCPSFDYTKQAQAQLKQYMSEHHPIISIVPTFNSNYRYYGVISAIIHSSYISTCFPSISSISFPDSTYIPILIKYSTLYLEEDEVMLKSEDSLKFVFAKMALLNKRFNAPYGIIIGRKYKTKKQTYIDCFDRVGLVDFSKLDLKTLLQSTVSKSDTPNPIQNLWCCGETHFERMKKHDITSIQDPRCTAELLGFKGQKASTLNAILNVQRDYEKTILPERIDFPPRQSKELYVDFETIPEILTDPLDSSTCQRHDFIFMIGIGWYSEEVSDRWHYRSFVMKELTLDEERRVLEEFLTFVHSDTYRVYHWSSAEPNFLKKALERHHSLSSSQTIDWFDLCQFFRDESIAIQGCFNYSLKSVAPALYRLNHIQTIWDEYKNKNKKNGISDGMECASQAVRIYDQLEKNKKYNIYTNQYSPFFRTILEYNEIDCKVMGEITDFLRRRS